MEAKKTKYSRAQKIAYYAAGVAHMELRISELRDKLAYAKKRLAELQSDDYQDWDSDLAKELETKKAR